MPSLRLLRLIALGAVLTARAIADDTGPPADRDAIVHLPRFEVRESGLTITDFGMSVVTNFGVLFGGKIAWMRVGTVVPGSSAALAGLATDDRIALIDRQKATDFDRAQMLQTFFHRKPGERLALLVREDKTNRWRVVELRANTPRAAP